MGSKAFGAAIAWGVGVAAVAVMAAPAWAQWNNEPYSYRSGGSSLGMSTAYRQAYLDQQISGNRPRNLIRAPDGSLLSVVEKDRQAFLVTPQPNYRVNRTGSAAGITFGVGGIGVASAVDGWTGTGMATGAGRGPIDGWVAQLDTLQPAQ